jgi:AP-3 complex subunit delta-1
LKKLRGLGYDVSWAEFSVVEIMSQPWYGHKRIAYLGASKMFSPETQLALLVTHSLKKTFTIGSLPMKDNSSIFSNIKIGSKTNVLVNVNPADGIIYEKSAALNCLANIATDVLAETLIGDVFTILTSSSQLLQKKSTLTLFRLIEKNPPSLLDSFERLKAKLLGDDVAVVNAAVNVFCELAKRNPKNYIILAPILFDILAKSSNNWLLIKTCKLVRFSSIFCEFFIFHRLWN